MKRTWIAGALASLVTVGNAVAADREQPIAVNVTNLQPHVAAQVIKHAQEGPTALARYLERVRPRQQLSVEDVTQPVSDKSTEFVPLRREIRRHAHEWRRADVTS